MEQIKGQLYTLIERSEDEDLPEVVYQVLNQDRVNEKIPLTKEALKFTHEPQPSYLAFYR